MQSNQTIDKLKDCDFLRTILTNLPVVAFVIAPDGTILLAEGKGIALAGFNRDDVVGTNVSEYFSISPGFEDRVRRVLEGETLTSTVIAPSQRSLEVTYSPLRDDRGSICGVIGVAQDVTERRKTEQELRDSEEKFRSITSAATDAIIMMDQSGRISLWNEAAQVIFGYTEQEAIGQDLHFLVARQHHHDQTMMEGFASRGESPLLGKVVELIAKRKSGEEFPLELSLSAFRLHDQWHAVGTARDITKRKNAERQLRESEEKFSKAFQANAALMAITDIQTNGFVDVNETFIKVLGFARDEVISRTAGELGLFVDIKRRQAAKSEVEKGKSVRDFEATVRTKSGESRYGIFSAEKIVLQGADCMLTVMVDITERKQAEQALRESESAYRAIFENTGSATVIIEADTIISLANSEFEKLTGWAREEIEGKMSWTRFVVPEDLDMMVARHSLRRESLGAAPTNYEFRLHDKNGTIKRILLSIDMIAGTTRSVASLTDITERKRIEEALRTSEDTYRAIFENTGTATMIVEGDTTISLVNSEFEKLTGYTKAETEGKKRWIEFVVEKDVDRMLNQHHLRRTDPSAALRGYEFQLLGKDGPVKDVLMTVDIIPGTRQSVASCLDITERKRAEEALRESEERFRRIFEEGPLGMVMTGKDFRFIRVNAAFCRMLDYSAPELTSLTFKDITHPDHLSEDSKFVKQVFSGEIPRYHTEKRYIRRDKETVWGALTLSAIRSDDGQFLYFLAMIEDITERKRAQEEKERLQQQLQQSQKLEAIGTMAGGIAHDFNNILTGILGFTELVRSEVPEDSEIYSNLAEVVIAGRRARDLVKQILSFSRMAETEKSLISLGTIVKDALKLIRSVTSSQISIKQNFTASPARAILADPTQMHQVVLNLCINAADAMPDGGVLEISLEEVQLETESRPEHTLLPSGCYLKLTVRDNGVGMSPEVRERIFEPYFTTKQVGKGTGMGLAVVHGVIKEHGGSIAVSSEPGKGTAFEICLPIVEATLDTEIVSSPVVAAGSESILFVDDETMITSLQRSQLGKWGYRVTATENSVTALGIFRASPRDFDLVITDQSMPGLTGVKLAQAIHEISPSTPIILCTGFDEGISRENAGTIGIRAILTKPITGAEFSCTIRMVLDEASKPSPAKS